MTDKVRVGIIGGNVSGWAGRAHMPALLAGVPGAELVAVSTTRQESADEAARQFGAKYAFDDHRRMLELADVDVVTVAVKLPHHYELTKDIIDAGKHVYTEWPLATTTAQAEELAALAKAKGVRTAVGLQARRAAVYRHVRRLVDDGYLGQVLSCTVTQFSGGAKVRPAGRLWMRENSAHANTLTIGFGHTLDGTLAALGPIASLSAVVGVQVPEIASAETGERFPVDAPDDVLISGRLTRGGSISMHVASVAEQSSGFRFEVHGMEGSLTILTDLSPHLRPVPLLGARAGEAELHEIEVPEEPWVAEAGLTGVQVNVGKTWADFAKSILDGTSFDTDFDAAVAHHKLLDAVQRASDTGAVLATAGP